MMFAISPLNYHSYMLTPRRGRLRHPPRRSSSCSSLIGSQHRPWQRLSQTDNDQYVEHTHRYRKSRCFSVSRRCEAVLQRCSACARYTWYFSTSSHTNSCSFLQDLPGSMVQLAFHHLPPSLRPKSMQSQKCIALSVFIQEGHGWWPLEH